MKKDVSLIVPCIRPQFLETLYASIQNACKKYSFEIIIPTPFEVTDEIKRMPNVTVIKTYNSPCTSFQMAALLCNAEFIYSTADDGFLLDDVVDMAIDLHRSKLQYKDVIYLPYMEDALDVITLQPKKEVIDVPITDPNGPEWLARRWGDLQLPGIKPTWRLAMHFFMKLEYFYELGGFDCEWNHLNHPTHDLTFRIQEDGGKIEILPKLAYVCSHQPGKTGDHAPINDAQLGPDTTKFNMIYGSDVDAASKRIKLNYSNWKDYTDVWTRRFFKTPLPITREEYERYKT